MGSEDKDIELKSSVVDYFYEQVKHAIGKHKIRLSEMSEWYAVNLLSQFATKTYCKNAETDEFNPENQPVGITYYHLMAEPLPLRIKGYKAIGGSTLFMSGFFSDSFIRKLVDIDYYMGFGMRSYDALAHIYDAEYWDQTKKELFSELKRQFRAIVDIFADVRDATDMESRGGLLRIYDRWLKTQSERDAALLLGEGIIPNQNVNLKIVH